MYHRAAAVGCSLGSTCCVESQRCQVLGIEVEIDIYIFTNIKLLLLVR